MLEQLILALYLGLATCAGLTDPRPEPPRIVFSSAVKVSCPGVTASGWCKGVYHPSSRSIVTSLQYPGTIAHELFHDILCQEGHCDPQHRDPRWQTCPLREMLSCAVTAP